MLENLVGIIQELQQIWMAVPEIEWNWPTDLRGYLLDTGAPGPNVLKLISVVLPKKTSMILAVALLLAATTAFGARVQTAGLDTDSYEPGSYTLRAQSEPDKQKMLKGLGCYCKKARRRFSKMNLKKELGDSSRELCILFIFI